MIKASSIEVLNKKTWEKVEGFKGVKKEISLECLILMEHRYLMVLIIHMKL